MRDHLVAVGSLRPRPLGPRFNMTPQDSDRVLALVTTDDAELI